MIDLHIHSTCSDGTLSPAQIVSQAESLGLYGFSLTDHDTTEGIPSILALNPRIHFIPGIEISCDISGREIHVLGYGIDCASKTLNDRLTAIREGRMNRNLKMISLFQKDGYPVTLEKLQGKHPDTVITRAHFARVLQEEGICKTKDEAFRKYLGETCKYFVPKPFLAPEETLSLIRAAGGIPVLAHPFQYHYSNKELRHLIEYLKDNGLLGLEVYHSTHHIGQITRLREWAKQYSLLETGGSDFHGTNKPDIQLGTGRGSLHVPDHLMDRLEEAWQKQ
ncbi:PHP domain-containing protein [Anaerostipes sp.]|uniref:PHP domain-containing protein n=1 Tax=Anaerostipes sp. TaxID=1872530 RepID=UPI00257BF80B|nr:PHP domain-containing protein [Anaerostipes sp.]